MLGFSSLYYTVGRMHARLASLFAAYAKDAGFISLDPNTCYRMLFAHAFPHQTKTTSCKAIITWLLSVSEIEQVGRGRSPRALSTIQATSSTPEQAWLSGDPAGGSKDHGRFFQATCWWPGGTFGYGLRPPSRGGRNA